jgi:predicted transcriptional regulator
MTNEQKEKINQRRQQGIGYKQIANEIGLSRDSVRGYSAGEIGLGVLVRVSDAT